VTVDGEDSLELDDGFSLTQVQGNWRLGLHIADAAHYVTPGSALDREAMQRALSVYLLDREIPMLPPRLSQQICSLVPGSPRLALSCLVELSPQGEVLSYKFAETVINSRQRLTYTQVDQGDCGEWNELVSAAKEVQQLLYQRRRQRGAAYIDLPATEIDLDTQGRPVSMAARQSAGGRELVEEFMILINELAADYLHKRSISFLHRGNEGFHPGRIEDINGFLSRWGHKLDSPAVQDLQGLLDAINQRPEQLPISRKLARGLRKSRYSVKPLPHYNMALDRYTHISSPIRRYSDLFIHRLVKQAIRDENTKELERDLPRIAQRCSFKEQLAGDVERECLELKKLQYLEQSELEYSALVVEQTGSGPLVWLENAAEGIVVAGAPREKLSGYVPGEKVKVKVHKLDYNAKRIYFSLME